MKNVLPKLDAVKNCQDCLHCKVDPTEWEISEKQGKLGKMRCKRYKWPLTDKGEEKKVRYTPGYPNRGNFLVKMAAECECFDVMDA